MVEDLTLDGAALEHGPLGRARAGRGARRAAPGASAAPRRSSPDDCTIAAISSTKSGFPPAARRIRSRISRVELSPVDLRIHQLLGLLGRERLQPYDPAPAAAAVEQLRPRHADEQDRGARRQERDVLERSRRTSSAHWMSSKTATSGASAATASSSLRNAHAISSGRRRALASEDDVERLGRHGIELEPRPLGSSCFSTSTTGQYVIPSPYERQRPRTTVASALARNSATSRDLPTPADPTTVTSSHAGPLRTRSQASESVRSSCSRPTRGESKLPFAPRSTRRRAARPALARPCPSAPEARRARPRPHPRPGAMSSRRATSHRAARPPAAARRR